MGKIRDRITAALPWADPLLDYFDWKKTVVAGVAAGAIGAWSFVKDLAWPIIVTLALTALVQTAYLLLFPAFVKLIHVGVKQRPNHSIWKHKKQFQLYQAAALLADSEPAQSLSDIKGDSRAWFEGLCEALSLGEIKRVPTMFDDQRIYNGQYLPDENTVIAADELKKFCDARGRKPEFLA